MEKSILALFGSKNFNNYELSLLNDFYFTLGKNSTPSSTIIIDNRCTNSG